jgi:formylglycine-generating enzyme required for sulfatase activity
VIRRGSWNDYPARLRVSLRLGFAPDYRYIYLGFRLVQD